jgi:hypothetical protein
MTTATATKPARPAKPAARTGQEDRATGARPNSARPRAERENVRAWTFQSAGPRKYALQIQKAANGNPCLRIVEGTPLQDGTFRKFDLTIWSEDFGAFFETLEQVRSYITEHNIRTPEGHKYDPNRPRRGGPRSGGRR